MAVIALVLMSTIYRISQVHVVALSETRIKLMFPKGREFFNSNGTMNGDVPIDCANCIPMACTCICSCCFGVHFFYTAYAWWARPPT